jgi:myo-inositol 2-dehydrogenase / D-chiro-inositol 1-dehydrogenase
MVNVCLIGAGRIGRMHASYIASHPDLRLCRVVDVNPATARELALTYGAVAAEDPIAAIADPEVDAVLIASSSSTHAVLIGAAVKARKPVFCEKPLDLEVERARDCVAEIEAAGVPVFLAFNRRFDANHAALYQALRAGEAGAIELVSITSRDPEPPRFAYLENAPGALFLETMVHDLDMAR